MTLSDEELKALALEAIALARTTLLAASRFSDRDIVVLAAAFLPELIERRKAYLSTGL